MSVPLSAWTAHEAAHAAAAVPLDVPHHHEADGSLAVHDQGESDSRDAGPDHMPSIVIGVADLPGTDIALVVPVRVQATYTIPPLRELERHASDGLKRPPRLG